MLADWGVIAEKTFFGLTVTSTENLKSVGAVVAEKSLESDTQTDRHTYTLTCYIDPVSITM